MAIGTIFIIMAPFIRCIESQYCRTRDFVEIDKEVRDGTLYAAQLRSKWFECRGWFKSHAKLVLEEKILKKR